MQTRSPRTILAISAVLALAAAAILPTAALARGGGAGAVDCDGDCTNEQLVAQQLRARDGSGQSVETGAETRGGKWAETSADRGNGNASAAVEKRAANRSGTNNTSTERGRPDDMERGPGACEECEYEMGELNDEQIAELVYMANEEKLAHDVYMAMADLYTTPVFKIIASAEAQHQAAVDAALERYGVEDMTNELPLGEFSDDAIAELYTKLVEQGTESLDEALAVGVFIEKDDIAALEGVMVGLDQAAPDVYHMYSSLLAGSERHLKAFDRAG